MRNQSVTDESEPGSHYIEKVPSRNKDSELAMRLREALGSESVTAFGRRCGIGEATLRKYFSGTLPNSDNLVAIADTANVNIEWLAAGRGPKKRGDTTPYVPTDADGIPQRIRMWRESLRMTQGAFAAALDLTVYPIRDWEAGEKPVDAKALKAMAETGANIDWLRTGKGEMRSGIPASGLTRNRMEYITPNSLDIALDEAAAPATAQIVAATTFDDMDRLQLAINTVEEALSIHKKALTPAKRALCIGIAYKLLENRANRESIIDLIKMAA